MDLIEFSDIKRTAQKYTRYNSFTCNEGENNWDSRDTGYIADHTGYKEGQVKVQGMKYRVRGNEVSMYATIIGEPMCPYFQRMERTLEDGICGKHDDPMFWHSCPFSGRAHMYLKRSIGYDQLW